MNGLAWLRILPLIAVVATGCSDPAKELSIVTRTVRSLANESTAGNPEYGISVPASGAVYWVEGQVKNGGEAEVREVVITFRVTDGNTTSMLRAEVPAIAPGKTVSFKTATLASRTGLRLVDEAPDVSAK
jgi:hypothetical protein